MMEYIIESREKLLKKTYTDGSTAYLIEKKNYKGDIGYIKHRQDGPAYIGNGSKTYISWWKNGRRHREDGPALYIGENRYYYLFGKPIENRFNFLKAQKENLVYIKDKPYLIDGRPIHD